MCVERNIRQTSMHAKGQLLKHSGPKVMLDQRLEVECRDRCCEEGGKLLARAHSIGANPTAPALVHCQEADPRRLCRCSGPPSMIGMVHVPSPGTQMPTRHPTASTLVHCQEAYPRRLYRCSGPPSVIWMVPSPPSQSPFPGAPNASTAMIASCC